MAMTAAAQGYMSRPCSITNDENLWYVEAFYADGSGGGVLAWCYDREDAIECAMELWDTGMFVGINYHKWQ